MTLQPLYNYRIGLLCQWKHEIYKNMCDPLPRMPLEVARTTFETEKGDPKLILYANDWLASAADIFGHLYYDLPRAVTWDLAQELIGYTLSDWFIFPSYHSKYDIRKYLSSTCWAVPVFVQNLHFKSSLGKLFVHKSFRSFPFLILHTKLNPVMQTIFLVSWLEPQILKKILTRHTFKRMSYFGLIGEKMNHSDKV